MRERELIGLASGTGSDRSLGAALPNSAVRRGARAGLGRYELLLILGFWTLLALLSVAGLALEPRGRGLLPVPTSGQIAFPFIQYGLWALLTPLIFWLASGIELERQRLEVGQILLVLAVGVVLAIGVDLVTTYLRHELFPPLPRGPRRRPPDFPDPFVRVVRLWFLDDFALFIAVFGAGLARSYAHRLRARQEEAIILQAEKARLSAQLAEARLAALRTQLDPHFLFNTLNAISALVERDPRGVRRMIARLSELLRHSLDDATAPETPLRNELDFIGRYLEIMQIRFQGALEVEIGTDPAVLDALVPTLILQPLVENAIKHGVAEGERGGRIEIDARLDGETLVLRVCDDGRGPARTIVEGVGLRNTRRRLEALYGTAARLEVAPRPEGGTCAEVRLPFHTDTEQHEAAPDTTRDPETKVRWSR